MKAIKIFGVYFFMMAIVVFSSCNAKKNAVLAHRGAW